MQDAFMHLQLVLVTTEKSNLYFYFFYLFIPRLVLT